MRLAKYIARGGVASRRHAERLITSGRVSVGGRRVTDPARDVSERDEVTVDGRPVRPEAHRYYLLNKPLGVVSTAHDPEGRRKVTDLVPSSERLYPVGRLDADSTGLIVLTNDGGLANRLTHPSFEVQKTYRATVKGVPGEGPLAELREGIELEDGRTSPAAVAVVSTVGDRAVLDVTIHEGRKRQVRRMLEAVGHPVLALERVRLGSLELGRLAEGDFRELTPEEVAALEGAGAAAKGASQPGDR